MLFRSMQFVKTVNCEANAEFAAVEAVDCCDECASCRAIERGNHPDFRLVRPQTRLESDDGAGGTLDIEGALITTGQVAELISDASFKISRARRKVYIITSAERMNIEAANRLLKTLEEPPAATTFVLTAANLSALLPTIISRCQLLNFRPVPAPEAERCLRERFPAAEEGAIRAVVAFSGGRLGWAHTLLSHPEIMEVRKDLLAECSRLPELEMVDCLRLGEKILEAAERWWLAIGDQAVAEKALKSGRDRVLRTVMPEILDLVGTWFRDLILLSADTNALQVVNRDFLPALQTLARSYSNDRCQKTVEYLEDLKAQLHQNANMRLASEMLALRLITT